MKITPNWWQYLPMGIIKRQSEVFKLDPKLIAAICWKESEGRQFACRFEPGYTYFYEVEAIAKRLNTSKNSIRGLQATSWGLMQVMGGVAYERGLAYNRFPSELCMAQVGIEYGCRQLSYLWSSPWDKSKNVPTIEEVISSYNGGSPRHDGTGKFVNQSYVDDVLALMASIKL